MLNVVSSKARGEASMSAKNGSIKLVAGNSNPALAQDIAKGLGIELTKAVVRRFADMEIFVEIQENIRGSDMFILQSTSFPANDNLMELLIITDALRRASARRITAVVPYFGYARQDRKPGPRTPISAKLVADLLTATVSGMACVGDASFAMNRSCSLSELSPSGQPDQQQYSSSCTLNTVASIDQWSGTDRKSVV